MNQSSPDPASRLVTAALVIVMLASLVLAFVYFTTSASDLPSFLPGHQGGVARHHTKHGIAAVVLAVILGVLAYFSLGAKDDASRTV